MLRQVLSTRFIREVFLTCSARYSQRDLLEKYSNARQVLSTRFIREVLFMHSAGTLNEIY